MSKNEHSGKTQSTTAQPVSDKYRENFDRIFGKPEEKPQCPKPSNT
jgi:hypothetical protein